MKNVRQTKALLIIRVEDEVAPQMNGLVYVVIQQRVRDSLVKAWGVMEIHGRGKCVRLCLSLIITL